MLDWIKKFSQYLLSLKDNSKFLMVVLILLVVNVDFLNTNRIEKLFNNERLERVESEGYTTRMTPTINTQIQYILMSDPEASNVILLNYHNNNHSSQGFSYRYITYLSEKFRDDGDMYAEEFRELSYVNYGEEFSKIHNLKSLKVSNVEEIKYSFPKLYRKIKLCNATGVAFYPIEGVLESVGMIIILYKEAPTHEIDYAKVIAPRIQRLAIILDYDEFRKHLEEYGNN